MSISTFQKVTIVSCVVLCVALLLPKMLLSRTKRDGEGPAGQFPPMPPRASVSEEPRRSRAHNPEARGAGVRGVGTGVGVRGVGTAVGTGGKSNLAGQIIPIYGFAILLYILYILFKITSKGKTTQPAESRFTAVRSLNTQRKITDFELAQLQDRLNETKDVIERIISSASVGTASAGAAVDEEQLLQQLQEITRVMQEGRLVDSIPADTAESCGQQWDDLPDSRNEHFCCVHSHDPSTHTQTRDSDDPNEHEETISQSQPETDAQAGSDITPGPESEHSAMAESDITPGPESEHSAMAGSDITPGPESEHSAMAGSDITPGPESEHSAMAGSDITLGPESEHSAMAGSDITPGPESEHSAVRRRNKQCC
ncbi:protein RIC-3b [Siphateles boraxobius]|uniref:protein RIC-3b n=1 Tax=Siphateles boraxobius TaxID=180520 RepID=UPI004062C624